MQVAAYNNKMDAHGLITSIVAGLVSSAAVWFAFARRLTTREDVEQMIQGRVGPVEARAARLESLLEAVRGELTELRVVTTKLTVLLETRRPPGVE